MSDNPPLARDFVIHGSTCPDNPQDVIARQFTFQPRSAADQQVGATRVLKALAAAGFVVVPSEPSDDDIERVAHRVYRRMAVVDLGATYSEFAKSAIDAFLAPYRSSED